MAGKICEETGWNPNHIKEGRFKSLKKSLQFSLRKAEKKSHPLDKIPRLWLYPFLGKMNGTKITAIAAFAVINNITFEGVEAMLNTAGMLGFNVVLPYQKVQICQKISHIYRGCAIFYPAHRKWEETGCVGDPPNPPNYRSFSMDQGKVVALGEERTHNRKDTGRYKEQKLLLKIPGDCVAKGSNIVVEAKTGEITLGHIDLKIEKGRIINATLRK